MIRLIVSKHSFFTVLPFVLTGSKPIIAFLFPNFKQKIPIFLDFFYLFVIFFLVY